MELLITTLMIGLMLCPFTHTDKEKQEARVNWRVFRHQHRENAVSYAGTRNSTRLAAKQQANQ